MKAIQRLFFLASIMLAILSVGCGSFEGPVQARRRIEREKREEAEQREKSEAERKVRRAEYLAKKTEEREAYIKAHPTISEEIKRAIRNESIVRGMTMEAVRISWGDPERTSKSVGSWGVHEQWVYGGSSQYLYFDDGVLVSWQELSQ